VTSPLRSRRRAVVIGDTAACTQRRGRARRPPREPRAAYRRALAAFKRAHGKYRRTLGRRAAKLHRRTRQTTRAASTAVGLAK
jgi:hypothetical protein